ALEWIDSYGDLDGDGFVEYSSVVHAGLRNQGWKDSWDSLTHADGTLAPLPAALVEVQGYVFHAKHGLARVLRRLGRRAEADGLRRYGHGEQAELVARAILEAGMRFSDDRLPELFCGFARDRKFDSPPGEYLVSCTPQAWGAGALFHLLQSLAGVQVDVLDK